MTTHDGLMEPQRSEASTLLNVRVWGATMKKDSCLYILPVVFPGSTVWQL